jgi:hypothetical protein
VSGIVRWIWRRAADTSRLLPLSILPASAADVVPWRRKYRSIFDRYRFARLKLHMPEHVIVGHEAAREAQQGYPPDARLQAAYRRGHAGIDPSLSAQVGLTC